MPLRPCAQPGCPGLTHTTRCPAHTEAPAQRKQRGLTGQRGSTRQWRKTRARRIAIDNGRCTRCTSTERLHVHHVDGNPANDRMSNLLTLCEDCHQQVKEHQTRSALAPLYAVCGVPGSGKTTHALHLERTGQAARVSVDDHRAQAPGSTGPRDQSVTHWAFDSAHRQAAGLLAQGQPVAFDSTAVTTRARASLRAFARQHATALHLVVFDVGFDELRRRNAQRPPDERVPTGALQSMYRDLEASRYLLDAEGYASVVWMARPGEQTKGAA